MQQQRKSSLDLGTFGKIPPQATDLEEAILGAIMLSKEAIDEALNILIADCFYKNSHQLIFEAMVSLNAKSHPIDTMTVSNELKSKGMLEEVGGVHYVTQLTNFVVSSAHMQHHCRIVLEKFISREMIRIGGEMIGAAYDDTTDPFDLLDQSEEKLSQLGVDHIHGEMVGIDVALIAAVKQIDLWRKEDSSITGVPSGYRKLDIATRGWQAGDLIIIAARTSKGKTAFALNLLVNAASYFLTEAVRTKSKPKSAAMWSLEMKHLYLILRMLSKESKIKLYNLQTGLLNDEMMKHLYSKGIQKLAGMGIFFDDRPSLKIQHLKANARRLKKKKNLSLIIVDYLQLMTGEGGNREREIASISRELKNLAVELDIPIIALSQLSREVEKRKDMRPILADLRESGSLEQDADVVLFLWGPSEEEIKDDPDLQYRRFVRIAKQRNGSLIQCDFDFHDEIQFFEMIEGQNLIPFQVAEDRAKDFSERQINDKSEDLPF